MNAERWGQVDALLLAALERPPAERAAFLDIACDGMPELRAEVESLLARDGQITGFIETPAGVLAGDLMIQEAASSEQGTRLGPYELIREIAEGGMGAVYLATRADDHYRKEVAVKLLKRSFDTEDTRRHFRHERQILASLDQANIARLIDGGTTDDGRPYLVMDYVAGVPITHYCEAAELSLRQRLEMFRTVCAAVHYAHRNLVIHRDIKPDNVLVTSDGTPKLLDFGIAKLLDPELRERSEHTVTMLGAMTPDYASPEQVRGEPVTTATDVYSLGVLLYELLSGDRPYRVTSGRPDQIARVICEVEPEKPSTAMAKRGGANAAAAEDRHSAGLNPNSLRGDLDTIVLMAMRKEPERRYMSVQELAEDIRRYLEGLPVVARADTFAYRSAKFIRRNLGAVAATVIIFVALAAGVIATTRQRNAARTEKAKAERVNAFLQELLGFANPGWYSPSTKKGKDVTMGDILDQAASKVETQFADQPEIRAELHHNIGASYIYAGRLDAAEHHLRAALDTFHERYGDDHPDTARTLLHLGTTMMLRGNPSESAQLEERALAVYRKERRNARFDPRWYAEALVGLSVIRRSDSKTAEALCLEGLKASAAFTGSDRAVVAMLDTNLGAIRMDQGDLDGAEQLLRKAIQEYRALPGSERGEIAASLTMLGEALTTEGRLDEAEPLLREAVGIYRKELGEESVYISYNLNVQSQLRYLKGDYAGAEARVERAIEIFGKTIPQGNGGFAAFWLTLGQIMNKTGRSAEAESLLRKALAMRTRALPKGHVLIAIIKEALGECLTTQRRYAEAEPLLVEGYNDLKASQGEHHPTTARGRQRLIELYTAWGKSATASQFAGAPSSR